MIFYKKPRRRPKFATCDERMAHRRMRWITKARAEPKKYPSKYYNSGDLRAKRILYTYYIITTILAYVVLFIGASTNTLVGILPFFVICMVGLLMLVCSYGWVPTALPEHLKTNIFSNQPVREGELGE